MSEITPQAISKADDLQVVSTHAGYERWAQIYDGEDNPLVLLEELHVWKLIGNVKGLTIADIGCGTGRHAVRLAAAGAQVTAVDFSEAMLQRAMMKPGSERVRFIQHDLARPLPLPNGSFDRVLSCLVLDHMADLSFFFGELRRLCRTDGFIALTVMHPALLLRRVQARFTDPATGEVVGLQSYSHQIADYLMAALHTQLNLQHIGEYAVDKALAARSPRAEKYLDWPLLLTMKFSVA